MIVRRASSAFAVATLLVLGACSSDSTSTTASNSSATASTASTAESASSSSSSAAAASLATATNAKIGQPILVDGRGMTVYLFTKDTGTTSAVPAAIKANWPPVVAATATAGAGLDQSKLTVATQADGTRQLAYNGHLLYTFVNDKAAGDANGQGIGGIWFVLSAAGDKIG